jgi:hypothetical protein
MKMLFIEILSIFLALHFLPCPGDPGDAYSMINALQTECEFEGLTTGSRLADVYNSYDESVLPIDRTHHHFYHRVPYFSRMIHYEVDRHYSVLSNSAHSHHKHSHPHFKTEDKAHHNSTANVAFRPLLNKWVYFLGDGTLKPIISTLLSPFHGKTTKYFNLINHFDINIFSIAML